VRVAYDYGTNELPGTIRRAVAFKAASELADEAAIQIPNNVEVRSVESLADQLDAKAEEKLDEYR